MDILKEVVGKTIKRIEGLEEGSCFVDIYFTDNTKLGFYHWQDCCENVNLHDFEITTSLEKIVGGVINDAREDVGEKGHDGWESFTWTFYNINTSKGCINMRWLGESNGYYSESVDLELVEVKL